MSSQDPRTLHRVIPQPIEEEELKEIVKPNKKFFGIPVPRSNNINCYNISSRILYNVQKYSSYSFTVFIILHGINVLVVPAIDVPLAEEVLMMTRDVYQEQSFEKIMVFGSLISHVLAGFTLRVMRYFRNRIKRKTVKHNKHPAGKSLNDQINLEKEMQVDPRTGDINIRNESIGLGGWYSVLNLGIKKSVVSTRFGLTPLQFSGILLTPVLAFHIFKERLAPLVVDGDSSLITLRYVSHAINAENKLVGFSGFGLLIYLACYHVISGWMKWLKIHSLRKRRMGFLLVNFLTVFGLISLWKIIGFGPEVGAVGKAYDSYLNYNPINII